MGRCEAEWVRERVRKMGIGWIHKCETNYSMQEWLFVEIMVVVYVAAVIINRLILTFFRSCLTEVDLFTSPICWSDSLYCFEWEGRGDMIMALCFGFHNIWFDLMKWSVRCFSSLLLSSLLSSLRLTTLHMYMCTLSLSLSLMSERELINVMVVILDLMRCSC